MSDSSTSSTSPQRHGRSTTVAPLLVVGGARSGKTPAPLTYRHAPPGADPQNDPDNILAVTFTNKAAKEIEGASLRCLFAEQETGRHGKFPQVSARVQQPSSSPRSTKTFTKHCCMALSALLPRICRVQQLTIPATEGYPAWDQKFSILTIPGCPRDL